MATTARYALYYAPRSDEPLAAFGRRWLGRDVETGRDLGPFDVQGFTAEQMAEITADPRHYGFHGTLKPPFALAGGRTESELLDAVGAFARRHHAFAIEALRLADLGDFIALVPAGPCAPLAALAADCVREFDRFRRLPDAAELARRRTARLSPRQDELLVRWGYPYVMDEFRFHLTLTGKLAAPLRQTVRAALAPLTAPLCGVPVPVGDVVVFQQIERSTPFRVLARAPLAAA